MGMENNAASVTVKPPHMSFPTRVSHSKPDSILVYACLKFLCYILKVNAASKARSIYITPEKRSRSQSIDDFYKLSYEEQSVPGSFAKYAKLLPQCRDPDCLEDN